MTASGIDIRITHDAIRTSSARLAPEMFEPPDKQVKEE
jgi:hypothetical protein